MIRLKKGFTLIELLIVIAIIGVLVAISIFGLQGAREAAKDARRKSDLAAIQTALESYRTDCNAYPLTIPASGALVGSGSSANCPAANVYMANVPDDPIPAYFYVYYTPDNGTTYSICAHLDNPSGGPVTCGASGPTDCGGVQCNYRVTNP